MSSAVPGIPPDIGRTAGPLLIGYLFNWGLFGVLATQVYVYYLAFPNDPMRSKILVYGVFYFELAQVIMLTSTAFDTFATGFGNMNALNHIGIIWFSVPIMSSAVAFVVQAFYAYRISVLSQGKVWAVVILILALVQLGGGLATGVLGAQAKIFSKFLSDQTFITTAFWSGGAALCDVVIAVCMTIYLSKRSTQWTPTKTIIQRLIRLIIETGTLTATVAIINLILSVLSGRPTYYQTTSSILGKLYSNTMMVVLNSRMKIGRLSENSDYSSASDIHNRSGVAIRSTGGAAGGIQVTREEWSAVQIGGLGPGNKGQNIAMDDLDRDVKIPSNMHV